MFQCFERTSRSLHVRLRTEASFASCTLVFIVYVANGSKTLLVMLALTRCWTDLMIDQLMHSALLVTVRALDMSLLFLRAEPM